MISYNEITVQDKREIENYWVEYWKDKGRVNYDLKYLKLDRMETCFVFRNNNNLCLISGIDDISEFIPNTYRILTRATTTHYRPKVWGKYIEDKFFSNVVASISLDWCRKQDPNKKVVVTTNANSRITNVTKRSKKKWLIERTTENIYGVDQVVWDINYETCYDNRIKNYIRH